VCRLGGGQEQIPTSPCSSRFRFSTLFEA
jgi:hypothetical protein